MMIVRFWPSRREWRSSRPRRRWKDKASLIPPHTDSDTVTPFASAGHGENRAERDTKPRNSFHRLAPVA
jgi:hypothetical protein